MNSEYSTEISQTPSGSPVTINDLDAKEGKDVSQVAWEVRDEGGNNTLEVPGRIIIPSPKDRDASIEVPPEEEEEPLPEETPLERTESVEETTEEPEEVEEPVEKRPKPKNKTEGHRIQSLTKQIKDAQAAAYVALKEKQEFEKKLLVSEQDKISYYEKFLESQKQNILQALHVAEEEGDSAEKIKNWELLAQHTSQVNEVKKYKNDVTQQLAQKTVASSQTANSEHSSPQTNYPQDGAAQEAAREWLKTNRWANPNDPNYDQEMHEEADREATRLLKQYKFQGRGDQIGELLNEVTDYIRDMYEIPVPAPKGAPKPQRLQMKAPPVSSVSSVNTAAPASNNARPKSAQDSELSAREKDIAKGLIGFRNLKGEIVTDIEGAEKLYKSFKPKQR